MCFPSLPAKHQLLEIQSPALALDKKLWMHFVSGSPSGVTCRAHICNKSSEGSWKGHVMLSLYFCFSGMSSTSSHAYQDCKMSSTFKFSPRQIEQGEFCHLSGSAPPLCLSAPEPGNSLKTSPSLPCCSCCCCCCL